MARDWKKCLETNVVKISINRAFTFHKEPLWVRVCDAILVLFGKAFAVLPGPEDK